MSFKDIWADKLSALFGRKEEIIPMYLIVGLGNPGKQYEMTRHNIGFHTIDYIADKYGAKLTKLKFKAVYGEATISGEKVYLVKPQTYMNLSGDSVGEMAQFYKIPPENIIVIIVDIINFIFTISKSRRNGVVFTDFPSIMPIDTLSSIFPATISLFIFLVT